MDITTVALVTATTALVSAIAGPIVNVVVSLRQIRASVISTNRERWAESLRDGIAEYASLSLSAAMLQEGSGRLPVAALRDDPENARLVERAALAKNKVLLIVNPAKAEHARLCRLVEEAYHELLTGLATTAGMVDRIDAIAEAGRAILRHEWKRVKRGE